MNLFLKKREKKKGPPQVFNACQDISGLCCLVVAATTTTTALLLTIAYLVLYFKFSFFFSSLEGPVEMKWLQPQAEEQREQPLILNQRVRTLGWWAISTDKMSRLPKVAA